MQSARDHMTRPSPNQSAPSAHDGGHDDHDALLERVRVLLTETLAPDAASPRDKQLGAGNNPEEAANTSTTFLSTRERRLEDKLALALLELASEQDNLRVAARAGNALLGQLQQARDEASALQDELEAAHLARTRAQSDAQRAREEIAALRVQRPDAAAAHGSSTRPQRASDDKTSCSYCSTRDAELSALGRRSDELRRRCLELELAGQRGQQRVHELLEQLASLQTRHEDAQDAHRRVTRELDAAVTQLAQRDEEAAELRETRAALRHTTRRLAAEAQELQTRLAARDARLSELEAAQTRRATQLQVAENRAARAQEEAQRAVAALATQQVATEQSHGVGTLEDAEEDGERGSSQTRDLESLLQDATRETAALRLENQLLRRHQASVASAGGAHRRRQSHRPRKATWTGGTTAADVLALALTSHTASSGPVSSSLSSSRSQDAPVSASERPSLATDSTSTTSTRPRNVSLGLDWAHKAMTSPPSCSDEPETPSRLLSRSEDRCMISDFTDASSAAVRPPTSSTTRRSTIAGTSSDERSAESGATRGSRSSSDVALDPLEDLRRADATSPAKSPLYLGLSFIACATAAGLLARR